ncbi:hypothetical protein [Citrobacter farmeri]|uniref:hypothetical protein n=1 Tax=Citrobacter farmeri TaxID=67824 RepID=UPI00292EB4EE|nr:hypothetical protein [Citrobacter farmeri]
MIKKIFLFFLLFMYLLSPTFEIINISSSIIIFAFVGVVYFLRNKYLTITAYSIYVMLFFLFLSFYSGLIQLTLSDLDVADGNLIFLKIMINNAMYLFFGIMLLSTFMRDEDISLYLKIIVFIVFINSVLIIIASLLPEVKNFLESILSQDYDSNLDYANGFRARGLAAAGGFSLSALGIVASIICVFLCSNKKMTSLQAFIILLVITISQIFIARTGLYFCIAIFISWYAYSIIFSKNKLLLIIIALIGFSILIISFDSYSDKFAGVLSWAFELFNNITSGSGVHTNSTDDLLTMFSIPSDLLRIIFGFGFYEADVAYRSDSGFVRSLYSVGLLSIFIYLFHGYFLCKKMPEHHRLFKSMFIIMFAILFILEIKGPVFYQNYTARFLFILYAFFLVNKNKYQNNCYHL